MHRAWRGFRWMTRSLWFRLMGTFAVVIVLMLFMVMSVIDNFTTHAFRQYIDQRNEYIRTILPTLVEAETSGLTAIEIRDGQLIIRRPQIEFPERPAEFSAIEPGLEIRAGESASTRQPVERIVVEDVIHIPLLDLFAPNSPESWGFSFLADVQQRVQTAVITAGIVSLVLGTVLFYQITRPLSQMRRAAQALAAGETNVQVPVRSKDELGKVAEAFNQMAGKISQQEQLRQQMVADVAHELRTPLTVMKANLEGMLDGLLEPNSVELGELHEEVQRLSRLIDDLRLLSLADSGQLALTLEAVDVRQVIARVVALLTPLVEAHEVRLVADVPEQPLIIMADADRVQQALTNLVANGVRHTPAGGRVRVTAVQEKQTIHLSVIDSGSGIPPADLAYVFNRFWRSDKSRSRHSGGSGLGLAIVKQIAELHQGTVTAISPNNSGAIFTISLPIRQVTLALH
jgi:signal transduction histidine kinase